jgi:hypothetical protein
VITPALAGIRVGDANLLHLPEKGKGLLLSDCIGFLLTKSFYAAIHIRQIKSVR